MGMGKITLAARARYPRRTKKQATNKKLATIGTVKRLINHNVDKIRTDNQLISAQGMTTTAVITSFSLGSIDAIIDQLQVRFKVTNPTLNAVVRLVVFQWKDTTTPVIADLLAYTTDPLSPFGRSGANDSQFTCGGKLHLLTDWLSTMNTVHNTVRVKSLRYFKNKLLPIDGDGTEAKNTLYFMYMSDVAATPPVLTLDLGLVYHQN